MTPLPSPTPGSSAGVRSVFFYPQGTYYSCDIFKHNVPDECGDWYVLVLKDMLARGVVDDNTLVNIPSVFSGPLGVLRSAKQF
jgi:hypothetical protein